MRAGCDWSISFLRKGAKLCCIVKPYLKVLKVYATDAGEERCESVTNLIFKYVLPPNVQPVGSRRIQPSRKWQDSGSDREATPAFCSQRRQRRRRGASQEDDTDEEWTGGKGNVIERRITKPAHYVPPIRHLSLSQRQHSHLQPHVSSPMVNTPGGSEIRRLNSKCGSLVSLIDSIFTRPLIVYL